MAKIVSFTKSSAPSSNEARGHALDGFVDDGDLLEFSRPEVARTQSAAPTRFTQSAHPSSLFASDWSNQELADLYRAHSLIQSAQPGLECDRGISDEGDPWFLIGDEKGDVLVHICRIKGTYILDSVALPKALHGKNFNALIEDFLTTVAGEQAQDAEAAQEPANVVRLARGGTVCLHPSMMIAALVWTLLMNADELTLPPATGSNHKGLDQGQNRSQSAAVSDGEGGQDGGVLADMPAPAAINETLIKTGKDNIGADDFYGELCTRAMTAQLDQRDEKQLHVSAYSHALTTIAIAAGFYASAEASNVFWKSTQAPTDKAAVFFDDVGNSETHDLSTPLDHLSDALALLSSVVDNVVFQNYANYASESRSAGKESADDLVAAAIETMEASIAPQVLTMASEVFNNLTDTSQTNRADSTTDVIDFLTSATPLMTANLYGKGPAFNSQAKSSDATIQGIAQGYASADADINRYDASSFSAGLGKFGGELDKYADILGDLFSFAEEGRKSPVSSDTAETPSDPSSLKSFDEAARDFIDSKMANADLEMLVFANEIIFVDTAALSANNTTVSWQLEDGGVVSMIGLSSDMAEFLVA